MLSRYSQAGWKFVIKFSGSYYFTHLVRKKFTYSFSTHAEFLVRAKKIL